MGVGVADAHLAWIGQHKLLQGVDDLESPGFRQSLDVAVYVPLGIRFEMFQLGVDGQDDGDLQPLGQMPDLIERRLQAVAVFRFLVGADDESLVP